MTRPMTHFDATPGGRPCGAFRPNDARIEQVASTAANDAGATSSTAFPLICGTFTFTLTPDAQPSACQFSPDAIACNENADCIPVLEINCGCIDREYGANKSSGVECFAPPCVAVPDAASCSVSGLGTEDCQVVADTSEVAVKCVAHQCLTYAVTPGDGGDQ
jgi:hypothetical protein